MIEYLIAILIIALTITFFAYTVFKPDTPKASIDKAKAKPETNTKKDKSNTQSEVLQSHIPDDCIVKDLKSHLIKSIKEVKNLKHCYIHNNGHVIVFSDDKRITLTYIKSFKGSNDKGTRSLSKNVDMDLISDISYAEDSKTIACALKNSKDILIYKIDYEASKNKLAKMDLKITSNRVYEIRNVVLSKNGHYVATSVYDKDTEIQIYSVNKGELLYKIDTGGIHNVDMKITPDDNYLGIATFLNEISVIHFEKNEKFNQEALVYETTIKVNRTKSISGIKEPISSFEFSNDERFFIIACTSRLVKVFQDFGNFSESKAFSEFKVDYKPNMLSLYVGELFNGKIQGWIAVSNGADVYIYDTEGKIVKVLKQAHEEEIIKLKIVKVNLEDDNANEMEVIEEDFNKVSFSNNDNDAKGTIILISASRDGRIKFWDLGLK